MPQRIRIGIVSLVVASLFAGLMNTTSQAAERTPAQVADELVVAYAHDIPDLKYTSTVALLARLHLGYLTKESRHTSDVRAILQPYLDGKKPALGEKISASDLSGHLVFGGLYGASADDKQTQEACVRLIRAAADRATDKDGQPLPGIHSEMSDGVFMACPLLALTGRLTGETKYFDQALRYLQVMKKLDVRDDGLYRHSPLCEAAWGRGNGFPMLGLVLTLECWPKDREGYEEILSSFQAHAEALLKHQDSTGCWHQVIDHPESYGEFTCTCMIGFSMAEAVKRGWLSKEKFEPAYRKAWQAALSRIGNSGELRDVCEGTGKQKSLQDYFNRKALSGRDRRGGSMGLLFAVQMIEMDKQP